MKEYLDYNATTPVFPETAEVIKKYLIDEFGNAGSRTHTSGSNAKSAVLEARKTIANYVDGDISEVVFTSGATESNNIALFGLLDHAKKSDKNHIISTQIEHKAILDPLEKIKDLGFEVSLVKPNSEGRISCEDILNEIKDTTFLVSCMHANNETGAINDINEIASSIKDKDARIYFHSDCSQTFGKTDLDLTSKNVDMISFSGHKFHGPKGIGGLVIRKHEGISIPLKPIMFGGGQERGIRPGTLPVHLIAGISHALSECIQLQHEWTQQCIHIKKTAINAFKSLDHKVHGGTDEKTLPNTLSISFGDIDAEALILVLRDIAEISTGSACTSESYTPSHVLISMGLSEDDANKVVRLSWGKDSNPLVFEKMAKTISEVI